MIHADCLEHLIDIKEMFKKYPEVEFHRSALPCGMKLIRECHLSCPFNKSRSKKAEITKFISDQLFSINPK